MPALYIFYYRIVFIELFPLNCTILSSYSTYSKQVTVDEDLGKINLLSVQSLLEVHTVIPRHEDISLVDPAPDTLNINHRLDWC